MHDLKISGGTIVDGTGQARFVGDIGVKDGRIAEIGKVGAAERVLDADGAVVTPGFVDIHTHYDGQISWDQDLAPSCFHGVTTVVMGNCGVGFAPVKKTDRERLIRLMEGVEDIPGSALSEGITWEWETMPEYMDALDKEPRTIDYCAQVTHDALRVYAMGERAIADEQATEDDIEQMRRMTREALEAGAFGFSTGRSDNHRSADGDPTPASEATTRELAGIARAFDGLDRGVLQAVSDFDMDPERFEPEFDILEAMAKAGGRPMSVSLMQRDHVPVQFKRIIKRAEEANEKGLTIRLQCAPRGIGVLLGLEATFHPFMGFPTYKTIHHLPLAERVAKMRNPEFRAKVLSEKSEPVSGDGSAIPPLADLLLANIDKIALRVFRIGEVPDYEPKMESSLYARAYETGESALATVYDALLEDEGRELLYFPLYNYTEMSLDNVHKMITHPLALPGLSDGGAHVGTICDASFTTFLLTHWTRDRDKDRISLERAVQMQTHDTSRHMGLTDRGTIALGQKADLNIIEMDALGLSRPRLVGDLPAGGKRLFQDASGYVATIVNGVPIAENGTLTGERPGRLVRCR